MRAKRALIQTQFFVRYEFLRDILRENSNIFLVFSAKVQIRECQFFIKSPIIV